MKGLLVLMLMFCIRFAASPPPCFAAFKHKTETTAKTGHAIVMAMACENATAVSIISSPCEAATNQVAIVPKAPIVEVKAPTTIGAMCYRRLCANCNYKNNMSKQRTGVYPIRHIDPGSRGC